MISGEHSRKGAVEVTIDGDNLPVEVKIFNTLSPHEYERAIAIGYGNALLTQMRALLETRDPDSFRTMPSRRQKILDFLTAATWDQYMEKAVDSFGGIFRAESHFRDNHGRPGVSLVADNSIITTLDVSPDWAGEVGPRVVANEVVACGAKIRSMRSSSLIASEDSGESDDQLEARLMAHLTDLLVSRNS
ncbi:MULTISPECIES: hypothetical protein [Mycobacteroides]|uniref:hypothetical protein n=1 Tax=Mycobacteroides TaxID=670516 RepID=UPI0008A9F508|nr:MULTISPECIES: hypothetical protein [Mycobacteroides]OHU44462.1 hypothetical protein BKG78_04065 [Mycobacteroides chelonae]OHU70959.1 hypothetical protein BKG86_14610 [Mycobacteroides chelonae]